MDKIIKNQYNGFRLDGTLASRISWQGIVWLQDKALIIRPQPDGQERRYWSLQDEYGARISCFSEKLGQGLIVGEKYEMSGEIKIGKGGTFLNLKEATVFNGGNYHEKDES